VSGIASIPSQHGNPHRVLPKVLSGPKSGVPIEAFQPVSKRFRLEKLIQWSPGSPEHKTAAVEESWHQRGSRLIAIDLLPLHTSGYSQGCSKLAMGLACAIYIALSYVAGWDHREDPLNSN
jgi:hypothetical protein